MEIYSNLQSADVEEMATLKEPQIATLPNANVLVNFGENESGNLTYKGQAVGAKRPTETIELSCSNGDIDFVVEASTKSVKAISYGDSAIPLSSEIQKIEILFNDNNYPDWINLQEMINYDPNNPYVLFANKAFFSETDYMSIYFRVYFIRELNTIAGLIDSYKVNKARITYYTD